MIVPVHPAVTTKNGLDEGTVPIQPASSPQPFPLQFQGAEQSPLTKSSPVQKR
jgi:hypothetical protein